MLDTTAKAARAGVPWYQRWRRSATPAGAAPADALSERVLAAARAGHVAETPIIESEAHRFPFSARSIDDGLRYTFDFVVAVTSLGLRPGSQVLDFGAGFGWSTELLNRLGFETVTYDIDRRLIRIGRERLRLDPRCEPARVRHVAGNGLCLPFADAAFDGILCLNALHHMPDYGAVLAEMSRVLRPGGRAAFSEPGSTHSTNPATRMCMEQYGLLERDVIASEIQRLALYAGFRRLMVKPYWYPEHNSVDLDDWRPTLWRRLRTLVSSVRQRKRLMEYVQQAHLLFFVEKDGHGPASPEQRRLDAAIQIVECPTRAASGSCCRIVARCRNRGDAPWPVRQTRWHAPVSFGIKVLTREGGLIDDHRGRTALGHDVAPGEEIEISAAMTLEGLAPGSYRVLFDMVSEHVCWFQAAGSTAVERRLEVE